MIAFDRNRPANFAFYLENLQRIIEIDVQGYMPIHFNHSTDNIGVDAVYRMSADLARQLLFDFLEQNGIPNQYVCNFSVDQCKTLLYAAIGKQFYNRDRFNRYRSLMAWGNSLVGRKIYTRTYNLRLKDTVFTDDKIGRYAKLTVQSWDYVLYNHGLADYTLELNLYDEESGNGCIGHYTMSQIARRYKRCYRQAKEARTVRHDSNGLIMFPVEYWLKEIGYTGTVDQYINERDYKPIPAFCYID